MIDPKILDKLARLNDATILRRLPDSERTFFEYGFQRGYYMALKDLWHHANEVPEIGRVIIMENYYPDGRIEFPSNWRKSTSHNPIEGNTKKWLYVDDLLPKKGGGEQ